MCQIKELEFKGFFSYKFFNFLPKMIMQLIVSVVLAYKLFIFSTVTKRHGALPKESIKKSRKNAIGVVCFPTFV